MVGLGLRASLGVDKRKSSNSVALERLGRLLAIRAKLSLGDSRLADSAQLLLDVGLY